MSGEIVPVADLYPSCCGLLSKRDWEERPEYARQVYEQYQQAFIAAEESL